MPIIKQERETWNFREGILKFYIFYRNTYIFYIIEKVVLQHRLQGNKRKFVARAFQAGLSNVCKDPVVEDLLVCS